MTEKIANVITSGDGRIATLASAITSTVATSITTSGSAPTALQGGSFRIRIDNEICLVSSGQGGTTWTVSRGAEGSVAAVHASGSSVRHVLTAAALQLLITQGDGVPDDTADTFQPYRVIMLSDGTVKAIPTATVVPAAPTGLAVIVGVAAVQVTWTPAPTATQTVLYRDGSQLARITGSSYRDRSVTPGSTYHYAVQTIDGYGQRSSTTSTVSAFIDPTLNVAPTVSVASWPSLLRSTGKSIVRVGASDADAQALEIALDVDTGTLTPTNDPSVFVYTPA